MRPTGASSPIAGAGGGRDTPAFTREERPRSVSALLGACELVIERLQVSYCNLRPGHNRGWAKGISA